MARPARPGDADADAPEWWRRTSSFRRVPIIAAIILVALIIKAGHGGAPPSIAKSCTTPAFVLSEDKAEQHHALGWSVTGPPGLRYLLTVGASGFVSSEGQLTATPDPGLTVRQTQAASRHMTMDGDCLQDGHVGVCDRAGRYNVRLFRRGGRSARPSATELDRTTLTVTAP